jgi:glyoxylase-like metal-dependent hydrolase (beta-lactamase superfamily II)
MPVGEPRERTEEQSLADLLGEFDVELVRAENPSLLTLTGTNTWVVGREPAWVVDPGPALADHQARLSWAVERRGGLGGVTLTHDHGDHSESARALAERFGAPLAGGRGEVEIVLEDGAQVGPFTALSTPGHASDHFALLAGGACFTGDAVLGSGSVFITPHPGALSGYLDALRRLAARDELRVLCPGHGPPVWDPRAKLEQYVAHRLDREDRLRAALAEGRRSTDELLDAAWSDVPPQLRGAAAVTLEAHLDKLDEEGGLPEGVERHDHGRIEW